MFISTPLSDNKQINHYNLFWVFSNYLISIYLQNHDIFLLNLVKLNRTKELQMNFKFFSLSINNYKIGYIQASNPYNPKFK